MHPAPIPATRRPGASSKGPQLEAIQYARILYKEARKRILPLTAIFTGLALLAVVGGQFLVPKNY